MNQKRTEQTNIEKGQEKKKKHKKHIQMLSIHSKIIIKTKFKTVINKQKSVRLKNK